MMRIWPVKTLISTSIIGAMIGAAAIVAAPANAAPDVRTITPASAGPTGIDAVIPRPTDWTAGDGTVGLTRASRLLVDGPSRDLALLPGGEAAFPGPVAEVTQDLAKRVAAELRDLTGLPLKTTGEVGKAAEGDIVLRLVDDEALGAEGYRWSSDGPIVIEASTTNGLFYGTRTLVQLLEADDDHRDVPRATSTDVPTQAVRMIQLDAGRKYWSMESLENLLRRMGQLRLNTLFLHLSDSEGFRLYSEKFPGLADPEHSYSREDIDRLKALAAEQHVQLMGGIDVPGHATVISDAFDIGFGSGDGACTQAHTHSHLTPDWIIDMTREDAVAKTAEIVDEFSSWFDAPLFSIGADELPGQLANCPRVAQAIADDPEIDTLGDLLTRYINTLDAVITENGARTAIYNGVEHMSTPKQDLNASVVDLTWEGTGAGPAIPGHDEIAIGPFYLTPNNYHNLYPDVAWMYDEWAPNTEADLLGSGMPHWADYNFWSEDAYWEQLSALPRAVLADRSWNGSATPDDLAAFTARFDALAAPAGLTTPDRPKRVDDGEPSHRWTFDEAEYPSGWTWAGSPGNTIFAEDAVGDLPGSTYIINNPTLVDGGVKGEAFRFDHNRDGVGFGGVDVAEPWTVSTWVKLSSDAGEQVLLTSKAGALKLRQTGTGKVGFTEYGVADHSFEFTLPAGRWVQLTWVATEGETTLYADGARVGRIAASIPLPLRSVGTPSASLRGDLDELTTWDEALDGDQVAGWFDGYDVPAWDYTASTASLNSHESPEWFDDDKFGIFVHWGPYSVPAWGPRGSYAEWYWNYMNSNGSATNQYHRATYGADYPYDRFIDEWKAEEFDPEAWVDLFKDAGAKYFVLTSKHHDGTALWDSDVSGRDTVDLGPKRDLAGELFSAARDDGELKAGFYYSLYEWYNPAYTGKPARNPYTGAEVPYTGAPTGVDYVDDYMLPQMRELIDKYDPDILWCDGQWEKPASYWKTAGVIAEYYNRAKNGEEPHEVAVANRCKIDSGSLDSTELDFQTPEYTVKPDIDTNKWESSRGIAHSYGYNQNEPIEDYLTSDQLVESLVDIVSKNGNLLLDVGPKADGTIPELQAERLRDIGAWLDVNGDAIYGTTYWNRADEPASDVPVRYTQRDGSLYATALDWPGERLTLGDDLPFGDDTEVELLGSDGKSLDWERNDAGEIEIEMPEEGAEATTSTHAFTFEISNPGLDSLLRTTVRVPEAVQRGATVVGSAVIANPSSERSETSAIEITGPEGWTVTAGTSSVPALAPGESYVVPITISVPAGAEASSGRIVVTTTSGGVSTSAGATVKIALPNLAKGKPATQSSIAWDGVPERAVDGNRNGAFSGNSVTHTAEPSKEAWWQVDVGELAALDRVEIYNRTDCCGERLSNYWVMTSDEPFTANALADARAEADTATRVAEQAGRPSVIDLPDGTTGRYVRIQLESATLPLSLAEVEVLGLPAGG